MSLNHQELGFKSILDLFNALSHLVYTSKKENENSVEVALKLNACENASSEPNRPADTGKTLDRVDTNNNNIVGGESVAKQEEPIVQNTAKLELPKEIGSNNLDQNVNVSAKWYHK